MNKGTNLMRDYAAEMRDILDAETGNEPYVPRVVATNIVSKLRESDPELLSGWLDQQAENFVWQLINARDRSMRSHVRQQSRARAFSQDVETGDGRAVRWLTIPFTVEDGSRKRLSYMTKNDVLFAADTYATRAKENKMTETFLRVIARKLKGRTVGECYTDEQLSVMWNSLQDL